MLYAAQDSALRLPISPAQYVPAPTSRLRQYTVSIHTAGHNHAPVPLNGLEITRTSISIDIRVAHGRVFGVTDELWNVLVGVQVVEDIDTSTQLSMSLSVSKNAEP